LGLSPATLPPRAHHRCLSSACGAGLWESFRWPDETVTRSFVIMTTTPNAEMSELHDRMPVILDQQDWPTWLGDVEGDCTTLLRPAPDGLLRVWPVDRRVGSPRNNGPELLEPIAA
jgi:putative SOS response-associated peptidase YedK